MFHICFNDYLFYDVTLVSLHACFMRILASGVTNFDSEKHPTNFDKLKEGVQYSFEQLTAYDLRPVADQQLIGTTVPCSGSASHRYRNTYE